MRWQDTFYERMRDGDWHTLGELFGLIEVQIPLHYAMREALRRQARKVHPKETVPNTVAKWRWFIHIISTMRLEVEGGSAWGSHTGLTRARFRRLAGVVCPSCGGPLIPRSCYAKSMAACVSCDWADPAQGRRYGSGARVVEEVEDERRVVDAG